VHHLLLVALLVALVVCGSSSSHTISIFVELAAVEQRVGTEARKELGLLLANFITNFTEAHVSRGYLVSHFFTAW